MEKLQVPMIEREGRLENLQLQLLQRDSAGLKMDRDHLALETEERKVDIEEIKQNSLAFAA